MLPIRGTSLPRHGALRSVLRPHTSPIALRPRLRPQPRPQPLTSLSAIRTLSSVSLTRPLNGQASSLLARIPGQTRWISSPDRRSTPTTATYNVKQKETVGQILGRALSLSRLFKGHTLRSMFRQSPEETALALFLLAGTFGILGYIAWLYFNYFYAEQFTKYPPDVAKSLRRALYYSNHQLDPQLALKYYKLALEQCHANGLDPFSDDVVGIKIQMAAWLEKRGNIKESIRVLGLVLGENKKWLDFVDTAPERLPKAPVPGTTVKEGETERTVTKEEFERWVWSSRNRVLAKSCQISIKLGELCADDQVLDNDKSHEHLMWGVEAALKEFRRRAAEGVKEGEGPWMAPEEIGAALESLGSSYERKEQFDLALPLFFQALRLCQDECHMAVIMNNLAVSFAQHPPRAPYETLAGVVPGEDNQTPPPTASDQPWTRKELLDSAQRWAKNALSHAKEPTGEKRTPECDQACAVALVNLGNIAAMSGDYNQARQRYERAIKISEESSFAQGAKEARSGLQRLP